MFIEDLFYLGIFVICIYFLKCVVCFKWSIKCCGSSEEKDDFVILEDSEKNWELLISINNVIVL